MKHATQNQTNYIAKFSLSNKPLVFDITSTLRITSSEINKHEYNLSDVIHIELVISAS